MFFCYYLLKQFGSHTGSMASAQTSALVSNPRYWHCLHGYCIDWWRVYIPIDVTMQSEEKVLDETLVQHSIKRNLLMCIAWMNKWLGVWGLLTADSTELSSLHPPTKPRNISISTLIRIVTLFTALYRKSLNVAESTKNTENKPWSKEHHPDFFSSRRQDQLVSR